MLNELQKRHKVWARKNFGDQESIDYILGVTEEVGELSHAFLKRKQGIRNNEKHNDNINDAIGDIVVFLAGFCNSEGLDFEQIVNETWNEVEKRDWKKNPDCTPEEEMRKAIVDSGFSIHDMGNGTERLQKALNTQTEESSLNSVDRITKYLKGLLEPNPIFDDLMFIKKPFNNELCKRCKNIAKFDKCDPALDIQIDSCTKFEDDDTKRNLCDSCCSTYPECGAFFLCFGDGKGHDNIYKCAVYERKKEHLCDTCEHCLSFCSGLIEQIAKRSGIIDLDQDVTECSQYEAFINGNHTV